MAQSQSPRSERRTKAEKLENGDHVLMGINPHASVDDLEGVEYDEELHQAVVRGQVTEALSDFEKDMLRNGDVPMADFTVETESGATYTWNVDNGYIIGPSPSGRRTDVGKISGIYLPK